MPYLLELQALNVHKSTMQSIILAVSKGSSSHGIAVTRALQLAGCMNLDCKQALSSCKQALNVALDGAEDSRTKSICFNHADHADLGHQKCASAEQNRLDDLLCTAILGYSANLEWTLGLRP